MEFIDDHPVTDHRVRFRGRAEITDAQAAHVRDGHVVVWLVRARCRPPEYHPVTPDSDDRYRFNVQDVDAVVPLDGEVRNQALAYLDHHGSAQGYLNLQVPTYPQAELDLQDDRDLEEALAYLELHQLRRPGETLLDVICRLTEPVHATENAPAPLPEPNGDGVEVIGSVYRPGHTGATQALIEEAFGQS